MGCNCKKKKTTCKRKKKSCGCKKKKTTRRCGKPNCVKGKPCGRGCIPQSHTCRTFCRYTVDNKCCNSKTSKPCGLACIPKCHTCHLDDGNTTAATCGSTVAEQPPSQINVCPKVNTTTTAATDPDTAAAKAVEKAKGDQTPDNVNSFSYGPGVYRAPGRIAAFKSSLAGVSPRVRFASMHHHR